MELTLGIVIGLAAGFAACWYFVGKRRGAELTEARMRLAAAEADHAARREELEKARGEIDTRFKGIAAEILRANGEELRQQARERFRHQQEAVQTLVKPVGESLEKLQKRIGEIEEKRSGAYEGISKLIAETRTQMGDLRTETGRLNNALRSPQVRGRWGEQLLENIFELAGMRENVHYRQQVTLETDGGQSRPDFIVTIPGGMKIVIDSKTPLESYYRAHETEDERERGELLRRHAQSLANHARDLGRKDYGQAVEGALDMVVLFVPADAILDAAMRARTSVWEAAWRDHRVLIATPSVVIALLCTVHAAWQRETVQRNAEEIAREARELYHRLGVYSGHIDGLRRGLQQAVTAYNNSVGSFERRLLVQARKLEDLHAVRGSDQFEAPEPIDAGLRRLESQDEGEE